MTIDTETRPTVDELMAARGTPLRDAQPTTPMGRMATAPISHKVASCPPIVITYDDENGEEQARLYKRRSPTLGELERLQQEHQRVMERIGDGEKPTRKMLQSVFALVMPPDEAARFLEVENFETVLDVARQVGSGRAEELDQE